MKSNFLESFFSTEHSVFNTKLKPFSLYHYIALESIQSPIVTGGQYISLYDLEMAVLICSQTYSPIVNFDIKTKSFFQRLKLKLWHRINLYCVLHDKNYLRKSVESFFAYINDYHALPEFWKNKKEGKTESIPWQVILSAYIAKETGWSKEEIYNASIGELMWFQTALTFLETGNDPTVGEKDDKTIDDYKAFLREERKKGNK